MHHSHFTYETLLANFPSSEWGEAISIGTPRIRPFTEEDERNFPPTIDKEGNSVIAKVGRCLCIGIEGEPYSCSMESLERDREPIDEYPDVEGFRRYKMRDPKPIKYLALLFPFALLRPKGDTWKSQPEGGVITWNGKEGKDCVMRVIVTSIFFKTYKILPERVEGVKG